MRDDRTEGGLPLPHLDNSLVVDVERIRTAITELENRLKLTGQSLQELDERAVSVIDNEMTAIRAELGEKADISAVTESLSEIKLIGTGGLTAGTNGYVSARLPAGTAGAFEYVEGLGLFRFDAASTEPAEGETCIMPASGQGRWLLMLPDGDLLLSLMRRDSNTICMIGDATEAAKNDLAELTDVVQEEKAKPRITIAQQAVSIPAVSIPANNTQKNSVSITELKNLKHVAITPSSELPLGINYYCRYVSGTSIDVYFLNNTTAAITVPTGQWTITSWHEEAVQ